MKNNYPVSRKCLLLCIPAMVWIQWMAGCKSTVPESAESSDTIPKEVVVESFRGEDYRDGYRFSAWTVGEGAIRRLHMKAVYFNTVIFEREVEIDASVYRVRAADINEDDVPEMFVLCTVAGSGSYGKVIAYSFSSGRADNLIVPEISGKDLVGYMGHDSFFVTDNALHRMFPVYAADAPNSDRPNKHRVIAYDLDKNNELKVVHSFDNTKRR